ncbi:MAG: 50S ribosomal protein L9 [Planctomycetaceae bacterium]
MKIRRNVKVLLLQDDETLGVVGEIVDVRPGFARNYLFPQAKATQPTKEALLRVEGQKRKAVAMRAEKARQIEELAKVVAGMSLTIEERASEEGHLFGSVGGAEIATALRAKGIAVEARQVELERPIKELGIFNVPVRLDAERKAEVRVWVIEPAAD